MARRESELFARIADFTALREAALRAARGRRHKPRVAQFLAGLETEVLRLQRELLDGRWQPGGYTEFMVRESKPRLISAAPFRDRVVHHALCAVIAPLFERAFIARSYASLPGRGTHRAVAAYETLRDRHRHVLRADVFRHFPAIDHAVLKQDIRRRIACAPTLWLCDAIIDGSNPQEPVNRYFPGDELLTPWERRRLLLHPLKTQISETRLPAQFLGHVLGPGSRRRLPEENLIRVRGRLRSLRDRWRAGTVSPDEVRQRLGAWIAHARHADTVGLRHGLFRGGWFDPRWGNERPIAGVSRSGRVAPGHPCRSPGPCAAGPAVDLPSFVGGTRP